MSELDDAIHAQITELSKSGDAKAENGDYAAALNDYWAAFDLLPEPKTDWDAATWLFAAIGDANFLGRDYQAGVDNLSNAMHCPGAIGNPFLHMRLGQCQYEVSNMDRAADELMRAYAIQGEEIFEGENPKYLQFLQTKMAEPDPEPQQPDEPKKKKPWWKF